jgi:putative ABC transport system permease protein
MSLYEIYGAVETGLVFALVALGAFLTFRILDFPDLTVEGSFPLGAAVAAVLMTAGIGPWLATAAASLAGFAAGLVTAWLNVRFRIIHILAGILVSVALYSINLRIMSGPNVPLLNVSTVFTPFESLMSSSVLAHIVLLAIVVATVMLLLNLFLATGFGLAMRAAGANPAMAAANGVDVGRMRLVGLGLGNALTALAGALFAQIFGAADAYMGIGIIIVGFAAVIVGTTLFPSRTMLQATIACVLGALLYRFAVAFSLDAGFLGLKASDLQLVTALLVALALISQRSGGSFVRIARRGGALFGRPRRRRAS